MYKYQKNIPYKKNKIYTLLMSDIYNINKYLQYKNKYLQYKNKYLNMKNMYGGSLRLGQPKTAVIVSTSDFDDIFNKSCKFIFTMIKKYLQHKENSSFPKSFNTSDEAKILMSDAKALVIDYYLDYYLCYDKQVPCLDYEDYNTDTLKEYSDKIQSIISDRNIEFVNAHNYNIASPIYRLYTPKSIKYKPPPPRHFTGSIKPSESPFYKNFTWSTESNKTPPRHFTSSPESNKTPQQFTSSTESNKTPTRQSTSEYSYIYNSTNTYYMSDSAKIIEIKKILKCT